MNSLLLTSFSEVFNYILYVLIAILVLLVMITVHEFGHFITGKILGFKIEEFAIGFGPKIFSKEKKNGEKFSVRLFPLGGFCAFCGEDEQREEKDAFNNKKPWQRIIVLVSGAIMNYLLALIVIVVMFGVYGHTAIMAYNVDENNIYYNTEYSLKDRDVILKVNDKNVYLITDVMKGLSGLEKDDVVSLEILRNGKIIDIDIKLLQNANFTNVEDTLALANTLGLKVDYDTQNNITDVGFRSTGIKLGLIKTITRSFEYSFRLSGTIFTVLNQLFTGSLGLNSVGGTVTTITTTASAIKVGGLWSLLNITAFIGVNLAVFNLLPFPALDGSRAVFALVEWIFHKPINRKVENVIHTVGFILIIMFAILIDLQQCF